LENIHPALLDTLPTEAIPNVVCCYRDPDAGDSSLIRLEGLDTYPELVAEGPLGRLMTKGILDRYRYSRPLSVKDRTNAEQQRAQALEWIEMLKGGVRAPVRASQDAPGVCLVLRPSPSGL